MDPLAQLFGLAGFALIALWPLLRGRHALLIGQAGSAVAFVVHYLLIGAATGAAMSGLSVAQTAAAWPDRRAWWCMALYAATVPALAVLVVVTWAGPASACAAAGLALATLARWQLSPLLFRLLFLLSGFAWIAHDLLTGSLFGLLADLLCMATLLIGAVRDRRAAAPA